mmetsp:Transcript_96454/g.272738  ORF Transcript_96454/g.272738 Transcript_96454/m.272738 type:complete len:227 (-) Transcript_96454:2-682(-)
MLSTAKCWAASSSRGSIYTRKAETMMTPRAQASIAKSRNTRYQMSTRLSGSPVLSSCHMPSIIVRKSARTMPLFVMLVRIESFTPMSYPFSFSIPKPSIVGKREITAPVTAQIPNAGMATWSRTSVFQPASSFRGSGLPISDVKPRTRTGVIISRATKKLVPHMSARKSAWSEGSGMSTFSLSTFIGASPAMAMGAEGRRRPRDSGRGIRGASSQGEPLDPWILEP